MIPPIGLNKTAGASVEGIENISLTLSLFEDIQRTLRNIITNPIFAEEGFRRIGKMIDSHVIDRLKQTKNLTKEQMDLFDEMARRGSASLNLMSRSWSSFLTGTTGAVAGLSISMARMNEQLRQSAASSLQYGQTAFMPQNAGTSLLGQRQYPTFAQTVQEQKFLLGIQFHYNKRLAEFAKQAYENMYTVFTAEGVSKGLSGQALESYRQRMSTLVGSLGVLRGENVQEDVEELTNVGRKYGLTSRGAVNLSQLIYRSFSKNQLPTGGYAGNLGFVLQNVGGLLASNYWKNPKEAFFPAVTSLINLQREMGSKVGQGDLTQALQMTLPFFGNTGEAIRKKAALGALLSQTGINNVVNPVTGKTISAGTFANPVTNQNISIEDLMSAFRALATQQKINPSKFSGMIMSQLGVSPEMFSLFGAQNMGLQRVPGEANVTMNSLNKGVLQSVNNFDKDTQDTLKNLQNVPDILDSLIDQVKLFFGAEVPRGLGYTMGAAAAGVGGYYTIKRLMGLRNAFNYVKGFGGLIDETGQLTAKGQTLLGGLKLGGIGETASTAESWAGWTTTASKPLGEMGGVAKDIEEVIPAVSKFGKVIGVVGTTLAAGGALYEGYKLIEEISNKASALQIAHTAISGTLDALMLTPAAPIAAPLAILNTLTSPNIANIVSQQAEKAKNREFTAFAKQNFSSLTPEGQAEFLFGAKSGKYNVPPEVLKSLESKASPGALAEAYIMSKGGTIGPGANIPKFISAHKKVSEADLNNNNNNLNAEAPSKISSSGPIFASGPIYLANGEAVAGAAAKQAGQNYIRGESSFNEAYTSG